MGPRSSQAQRLKEPKTPKARKGSHSMPIGISIAAQHTRLQFGLWKRIARFVPHFEAMAALNGGSERPGGSSDRQVMSPTSLGATLLQGEACGPPYGSVAAASPLSRGDNGQGFGDGPRPRSTTGAMTPMANGVGQVPDGTARQGLESGPVVQPTQETPEPMVVHALAGQDRQLELSVGQQQHLQLELQRVQTVAVPEAFETSHQVEFGVARSDSGGMASHDLEMQYQVVETNAGGSSVYRWMTRLTEFLRTSTAAGASELGGRVLGSLAVSPRQSLHSTPQQRQSSRTLFSPPEELPSPPHRTQSPPQQRMQPLFDAHAVERMQRMQGAAPLLYGPGESGHGQGSVERA